MQRVTDPSVATALPPVISTGSPGYFTEGNTSAGEEATLVTQDWLNGVQEELIGLIGASGQTPSITTLTQVLQAVQFFGGAFVQDTGTTNALEITLNPPPASMAALIGVPLRVEVANTNAGASTITVNNMTAAILDGSGAQLQPGALLAGDVVQLVFNGTNFTFHPTIGRLINVQTFPAAGTLPYTRTPGTRWNRLRVLGGSGAGGGTAATGASQFAASYGGNAGTYAETGIIPAIPSETPVTVGAGGTPSAAGDYPGGAGGTSSVGAYLTCPGGPGGGGGAANAWSNTVTQSAALSSPATGTFILQVLGAGSSCAIGFLTGMIKAGDGGQSFFGPGGRGGLSNGGSAGTAGANYGAGGGGCAVGQDGPAYTGAAGFNGIVIIEEYA